MPKTQNDIGGDALDDLVRIGGDDKSAVRLVSNCVGGLCHVPIGSSIPCFCSAVRARGAQNRHALRALQVAIVGDLDLDHHVDLTHVAPRAARRPSTLGNEILV